MRYTNISHNDGIKVVETTLKRKGTPTRSKRTTYNLTFSTSKDALWKLNALLLRQHFMRIFEENYIYRLTQEKYKLCLRYIDERHHCVKSVRIRSFSGPYIPAFELNTDQKNSEYEHFSRSEYFLHGREHYKN